MENVTDALKIAFAVLSLVIALTVAITMFSQLNNVSKLVLESSDETQYYDYEMADYYDDNGKRQLLSTKNRIVGLETIIPNLYKYDKENYTIVFLEENGNPMALYKTQTNQENWLDYKTDKGYSDVVNKYYNVRNEDNMICSFDLDEETIRMEPWTATPEDRKKNLDAFLSGGTMAYPSSRGELKYDYGNGFMKKYAKSKFEEMLGEYTYSIDDTKDGTTSGTNTILKGKKKRVIVYRLLDKS